MVKKFTFRGLSTEETDSLSGEKLFDLLSSRARRSLKRGINDQKRKLIDEIKMKKNRDLNHNNRSCNISRV